MKVKLYTGRSQIILMILIRFRPYLFFGNIIFRHEFVDEFFANLSTKLREFLRIHMNFARKIGYVTNGLYCNFNQLERLVEVELKKLQKWINANKLTINFVPKNQAIVYLSQKTKPYHQISIGDKILAQTYDAKKIRNTLELFWIAT